MRPKTPPDQHRPLHLVAQVTSLSFEFCLYILLFNVILILYLADTGIWATTSTLSWAQVA